jgi:hypothetical protein
MAVAFVVEFDPPRTVVPRRRQIQSVVEIHRQKLIEVKFCVSYDIFKNRNWKLMIGWFGDMTQL